jgi:hypothetical protein
MKKLEKFIHKNIWLVIIGLSIPAVASLFTRGYFGVADDLHVGWLYEMDRAVRMGQFPPRYVPDLSFGFGYPLFNFVFPLPFYIGEIFHLLGFSLVDSLKTVFLLTIPFSMYFFYKLLRKFTSEIFSLAGAIAYVYAPYRATDIFVRGAVGEIVVFVFLPLVFLSYVKAKTKSWRWIGIAALATAAIVMSHNIVAYMFFPFLIAYLIADVLLNHKHYFPAAIRMTAGAILGLLASCYFWLPAIVESRLMKYSTVYNFIDHFPTIKQLITPFFGYGASVPGPGDGMSFFIGIGGLVLVAAGGLLTLVNWSSFTKSKKTLLVWALASFFLSVFMMNFRSTFVWENIPLLPYFQFPWRFLTMTTFVSPLLIVALPEAKKWKIAAIVLGIIIIGANYTFFRPSEFLGREDDYYINRYIPVPVASKEYRTILEDYLRLPAGNEIAPSSNYPRAYSDEDIITHTNELNVLDARIETESDKAAILNYNKYYFPGWIAKIDGEEIQITAGKPFGQIAVAVPAGKHTIDISFRETNFRRLLNFVSLGAMLISLSLILAKKGKK